MRHVGVREARAQRAEHVRCRNAGRRFSTGSFRGEQEQEAAAAAL